MMTCIKKLIPYDFMVGSQQVTNIHIRKIRKQQYKNVIWKGRSKQQKKQPKKVKVLVSEEQESRLDKNDVKGYHY